MSNWIGYAVSVNCGEPLGCYQGTILRADGTTITLTKAFRNGFPYPRTEVTLNAADIKELKIIETRSEPTEQTHSTVAVTKSNRKGQRATVCENLQANPSSSGNQYSVTSSSNNKSTNSRNTGQGPARSKPIDIQGPRNTKSGTHPGSYGNTGSTPKGRGPATGHERARRRNEACFGDEAEPALANDFDFEGNLALFDKRALWEQMRNSHKPDLVRQADEAGKFRHDENVLGDSGAGARRAIRVPDALRGELDYVTDDGVLVPAALPQLRRQLWDGVWRLGAGDAALTLLARAAADVALRLVGGGRRLDPRNAHQTPTVVSLLGAHDAGAAGAAAARLLAAHGARAAAHLAAPAAAPQPAALRRELAAAALAGVALAPALDRLPAADLVLLALHDPRAVLPAACGEVAAALRWARSARAAAVALEPPAGGWAGGGGGGGGEGVSCRAAVLALLPAALPPALGRVYLANVAPPLPLFAELGVTYRPPFGAASVLALHAADADD